MNGDISKTIALKAVIVIYCIVMGVVVAIIGRATWFCGPECTPGLIMVLMIVAITLILLIRLWRAKLTDEDEHLSDEEKELADLDERIEVE